MTELLVKINKKFGNKFSFLKLYEILYDRACMLCSITFLFPMTMNDICIEDRKALQDYFESELGLNAEIKIKFKKSYLDEILVKKEVVSYIESNHKELAPFVEIEDVASFNEGLNVKVEISLNNDVLSIINEQRVQNGIYDYLNTKFIASFEIEFKENSKLLPTEIDVEDIKSTSVKTPRYEVLVIKKMFGGEIAPKPEFIKNITKPKTSVILAGKMSKINKRSFKIKKGKHIGEEKSYYNFVLSDGTPIECVYFCPKSNEKVMDSLSDNFMLLCIGDVQKGLSDKLTYYIKKMAAASPCEQKQIEESNDEKAFREEHKRVVFPEKIPVLSQANLFEEASAYNDFINNNEIVVFDTETTGLNYETCEMIELGAVKLVNGKFKDRFSTFIKAKNSIPDEIIKLTGITDDMITDAPNLKDVMIDFYEYTRGCVLSGYNVVGFDMHFIKKAAQQFDLKFDNQVVDTMIIVRQSNLRLHNYKLVTAVKALGFTYEAHRAYNDAYATAQVLLELSKVKKQAAKA